MTQALLDCNQSARLEKKIDILQEAVMKLTVINESHKTASEQNAKEIGVINQKLDVKLDEIDKRIDELKNKSSSMDGGLSTFKTIMTFAIGIIVSLCGWTGSSIIRLSQENTILNERVTQAQIDIDALEHKVGR